MRDDPHADELSRSLRSLRPVRQPGEYVFRPHPADTAVPSDAVAWLREPDGASVIVPAGRHEIVRFTWIALTVESSLTAVGLTAAVSGALAAAGIACNVVAAVRHDHLFVPADRADEAVVVLAALQSQA